MYVESDDGIYRFPAGGEPRRVFETGQIMRLGRFNQHVFAATRTGLYRRTEGCWHDLGVPREQEMYRCVR